MKKLISLSLVFLLCYLQTFSQCPQSGLRIQSKDCDGPTGLAISSISCSEMNIKWKGQKGQVYAVKATSTEAATNNVTEAKVSEMNCKSNGSCTAIIAVSEGATINWSVQSICSINGATVYSSEVSGPQANVPFCPANIPAIDSKGLSVYPNPSKGSLLVEYTGKIENNLILNVYDVIGKKVFTQSESSTSNNQHRLDLHKLTPGTYMLEVVNGTETRQTKFVLLRE